MKDIIRLNGLSFYGYHGVTAAEKETGRLFEVDCEVEVDLADAGQTDSLTDTIDYEQIYNVIKDIVEGKAFSLLEGLAKEIAGRILEQFPIYRITLKVRKMNPPIAGHIKFIEVEISRYQADVDKLIDEAKS
jgi:dihydroneopterin aldolase